ncbi:MAG TPA: helix-hairpin-helix domain-containing protein [Paralcaligenes sp.]|jgi:DNA uptake protein and related DNA-binding proteins
MNPFTEPTVARPWTDDQRAKFGAASFPRKEPEVKAARSRPASPKKRQRPFSGSAFGIIALAASLSLFLPAPAHALDVNTATQVELRALRGIGSKTAQIIIEERSRGGRFESFEDLSDRVKGIGPKKAASLQAAGLTLGGQGAAEPAGRRESGTPQAVKSASGVTKGQKPAQSRTFKLRP